MNIEIGIGTDSEDFEFQEMKINGKSSLFVRSLHDCPEDACFDITEVVIKE